jgi:hypothetical protein
MINSAKSGDSRSVRPIVPGCASLHPGYEIFAGPAAIKPYPLRNCGSLRPKFSPNVLAWTYLISSFVGMHMTNRTGNFLSAILVGSLASVTLAHAADSCLSGPKGVAPKGSHWYYRVDHASKRNCWYVRAEGEKPVASQNAPVARTSPQTGTPLQPSIANARAEASPAELGQSNGVAAMPAPAVGPPADNAQSTIASRWLDRQSAESAPAPAESGADVDSPTAPVAEIPFAAAQVPPAPHTSVQTLLLAIIGAIALASLMAGVTFKFGGARRNGRPEFRWDRHAPWDSIGAELTPSPPLAASTPTPRAEVAHEPREAIIPNEIMQLLSKLSKEATA